MSVYLNVTKNNLMYLAKLPDQGEKQSAIKLKIKHFGIKPKITN